MNKTVGCYLNKQTRSSEKDTVKTACIITRNYSRKIGSKRLDKKEKIGSENI